MEETKYDSKTGYFKVKELIDELSFRINKLFKDLKKRRQKALPKLFQELKELELNYQEEIELNDLDTADYYLKEIKKKLTEIDSILKQMEDWIDELEVLLRKKEELLALYGKHREGMPLAGKGGWTSEALVDALGPECAGLCNAMSTGWQLGVLEAVEDTTGMSPETLDMMINLKTVLDYVVQFYHEVSSVEISRYFMAFFASENGEEILEMLKTLEGREALAERFEKYVRYNRGEIEMRREGTDMLVFDKLGEARLLCPHLKQAIGTLDISSDCFLIFSMKFYIGSKFAGGHEFSIKYHAAKGILEIYDQNFGLKVFEGIEGIDAIVLKIAEVMYYYYIENPIPDTTSFQIFLLK
jgi:hypothetical protein